MKTAGKEAGARYASAVFAPCSGRKKVRPPVNATAFFLPSADQPSVETAWQRELATLDCSLPPKALYAGRGWTLAVRAANASGGVLYAVSAGLGLVNADKPVPAYGITISGDGPESIVEKVAGPLDPRSWWEAVCKGPFATPMESVFADGSDLPVLVALTQPYARLLAASLEALPASAIKRLRILGTGLATILPDQIANQVLPYNDRLEAILAGTKADFPHRALLHFAETILRVSRVGDIEEHRHRVEESLAAKTSPTRPIRRRTSDEEIIQAIKLHLTKTRSSGKLLRILRDHEGIACEQKRFSQLHGIAVQGG